MEEKAIEKIDIETQNQIKKVRSYVADMIVVLIAAAAVGTFLYGGRVLLAVLLSVLSAVLTEIILALIFRRKMPERILDLSDVYYGFLIALMLPVSAPLWLAPLGSIFAVAIAKLPFGNATTTPFMPAAAGMAFITLSYSEYVFTYPSIVIGDMSAVTGETGFVSALSTAEMLRQSKSLGTTIINVFDIFIGREPGPMGATCLILMIGGFIYLLLRRKNEWITSAAFLATCCLFSVLFPRVLTGRLMSMLMELSSGMLFFAAIFLIPDPVTTPKTQSARAIYGFVAAVITMLMRYFGAFEESVIFAVLIMNSLRTHFDLLGEKIEAHNSGKSVSEKTPKTKKHFGKRPKKEGV